MKRLKTLRVRFALWTAGLLSAALALFGLFVYANMSRSLAATVDETLRLVVAQLVAEVDIEGGEPVIGENPIEDPEYAQLREQGFSMRLFDLTGQGVQEYGPYRDFPQPQVNFTVPNQPGEFTTFTDPFSQDPVRVYTTIVVVDDELVGTLQVAQNLKDVRRTLDLLLI